MPSTLTPPKEPSMSSPYLPDRSREHWDILDATKLQTYLRCPRKFFYEYVMGWRPEQPSTHLIFGQGWHAALEYLYRAKDFSNKGVGEAFNRFLECYRTRVYEGGDLGGKTPENVLKLLIKYTQEYADDLYKYNVLGVEIFDRVEIVPNIFMSVKLDALLQNKETGRIVILEHKTGSYHSRLWDMQWPLSLQIGGYINAVMRNCVVSASSVSCLVDGAFFAKTATSLKRNLVTLTSPEYLNWHITTTNAIYKIRADYETLKEADISQEILYPFPLNPTSCTDYGGCPYHDLCVCVGNPLHLYHDLNRTPPTGFIEEWWNPGVGELTIQQVAGEATKEL